MFSRELTIHLDKEFITFTRKGESLVLKPVVYLDHNRPCRIISIGDPPAEQLASQIVYLFDGKDHSEDKVLILEAFFRFGFRQILGSRLSLAPNVVFEISPELIAYFVGYHRLVLHHCAKMAGAHSTQYDKNYN